MTGYGLGRARWAPQSVARWVLTGLAMVTFMALLGAGNPGVALAQQGSAPTLSISPTSGPVGTTVTASGSASDACEAIALRVGRAAGGIALVREELAVSSDGTYQGFVVPEGGTPSGETPDEFIVRAFCADGSVGMAEATFTVTATDTDEAPAPAGGIATGAGGTATTGLPWAVPAGALVLAAAGSLAATHRRRERA